MFALQPLRYATERLKIAYVITLLTGRACEWGTAVWHTGPSFCNDFEKFRCEMTRLFDHSVRGDEAASKLARLRQGGRSVTDYAIQFKTLAASCYWNEGSLRAMFREGLNFEIQDKNATHELPLNLEGFINLATRVEGRRCVSDSWIPALPGGWRRSSLSRANHHLNRLCLILSPCSCPNWLLTTSS